MRPVVPRIVIYWGFVIGRFFVIGCNGIFRLCNVFRCSGALCSFLPFGLFLCHTKRFIQRSPVIGIAGCQQNFGHPVPIGRRYQNRRTVYTSLFTVDFGIIKFIVIAICRKDNFYVYIVFFLSRLIYDILYAFFFVVTPLTVRIEVVQCFSHCHFCGSLFNVNIFNSHAGIVGSRIEPNSTSNHSHCHHNHIKFIARSFQFTQTVFVDLLLFQHKICGNDNVIRKIVECLRQLVGRI